MPVPELTTDKMTDDHLAHTIREQASTLNTLMSEAFSRGLHVGAHVSEITHTRIDGDARTLVQIAVSISRPL